MIVYGYRINCIDDKRSIADSSCGQSSDDVVVLCNVCFVMGRIGSMVMSRSQKWKLWSHLTREELCRHLPDLDSNPAPSGCCPAPVGDDRNQAWGQEEGIGGRLRIWGYSVMLQSYI